MTKLTLSAAIREGAKKRPMAQGSYFTYNNYECIGSCALGAAYEALTGTAVVEGQLASDEQILNTIGFYTETDMYRWVEESDGGPLAENHELWRVISILNDFTGWTREQIADWLETQGL